ncbi:hypothetical protein C1645_741930 [Glomus cerebriforme]|uniref:BED-type domain-containing protein n=1 Tax=Glomus cerebriforme TaxID=658196 RepID=A0A397SHD3_9GLOM|nr:hypothetical protein C1645_741930 [Glomus cerebriforme]
MPKHESKMRKKKPVWNHFKITGKDDDRHPNVKCKYCFKSYQRAVPERMKDHLNECKEAPSYAKSQSNEALLVKVLISTHTPTSFVDNPYVIELFRQLRPSFKLPNREKLKTQILELMGGLKQHTYNNTSMMSSAIAPGDPLVPLFGTPSAGSEFGTSSAGAEFGTSSAGAEFATPSAGAEFDTPYAGAISKLTFIRQEDYVGCNPD